MTTAHGQVLEFQNSPITEEERSSREAIYRPLCWVVNGLRLKHDRQKFIAALRLAEVVQTEPLNMLVSTANCLLLRKWENSGVPVFFDFGEIEEEGDPVRFGTPVLWASRPGSPRGLALLVPMFRDGFLQGMINNEPLPGIKGVLPLRQVPNFTAPMSRQPWRGPRRNWRL